MGLLDSILGPNVHKLKMERDVDELIRLLEAGKSREQVIEALGWIGDPRAVEPIITALKNGNNYTKMEAAVALGKLNDKRAVDPLIAALNDRNQEVRERSMHHP